MKWLTETGNLIVGIGIGFMLAGLIMLAFGCKQDQTKQDEPTKISLHVPGATKEQIMNDIWADGYAIGAFRASRAKDDIPNILSRCYAIQHSPDPLSAASQVLLNIAVTDIFDVSVGNDTETHIAITWAIRRLSGMIGLNFNEETKELIPIEGFDEERFVYFVKAYTEAVEDVGRSLKTTE